MGLFGTEALALVKDIGRRIRMATGEPRSDSFLLQRISLAIQRGNAACVLFRNTRNFTKFCHVCNMNRSYLEA